MIDRRLDSGTWETMAPGVYALPSHPRTFLRQCWGATLAVPQTAVANSAAATLWRFTDYRAGRVELAGSPTTATCCPIAVVHRFDGAVVTRLNGLPITTMAQTVFDVAGTSPLFKLEAAIDDLVLTRRLEIPALEERLAFYDGARRAGLPKLRALIADRTENGYVPPESELERRVARILSKLRGHPTIIRQHPFPWRSRKPGRLDFWIPDARMLLEADSRRWHARVHDFDEDRRRDAEAMAHGIRPVRVTWVHATVEAEQTLALLEQIRLAP